MWKWLHPYAKAEKAYQLCGKLQPWFGVITLGLLLVGTIWGLVFAPTDYQQGDSFRIIYVHVPASSLSMGTYLAMAIAALIALVWQVKMAELYIIAAAPIGIAFTLIALFTGAAWGKPMWGAWWVWDARLTSELILLFIYIGILSLYNAFEDKTTAGKAASILTLVGSINLPIIHYSVVWWNTLHQGATILKADKPSMDPSMLWPLLLNMLGFGMLLAYLACVRMRNEILQREKHRKWVKNMIIEEGK
ncbi:MAG: heme exporter protein C [Phenylobacterium sp.]|jgi:heme exporter protein C